MVSSGFLVLFVFAFHFRGFFDPLVGIFVSLVFSLGIEFLFLGFCFLFVLLLSFHLRLILSVDLKKLVIRLYMKPSFFEFSAFLLVLLDLDLGLLPPDDVLVDAGDHDGDQPRDELLELLLAGLAGVQGGELVGFFPDGLDRELDDLARLDLVVEQQVYRLVEILELLGWLGVHRQPRHPDQVAEPAPVVLQHRSRDPDLGLVGRGRGVGRAEPGVQAQLLRE